MRSAAGLIFSVLLLASASSAPLGAQAPSDAAVYAVTYFEVQSSASAAMASAYRQYRDASRKDVGWTRFDLREEAGRPGMFTLVETWRDQRAADAHASAPHWKQYQDALRPIRVSGYDQRLYKALTVAAPRAEARAALHVVSHVDIVAAGQPDAPGILRRLAETSRAEEGCLRFDVLQNVMRPNHFTVVEVWRDQQALDAHRAAAHTREYRDWLQPVAGSPLDERWLKGVE